jgi:outer membrane protein assembly factor BamB
VRCISRLTLLFIAIACGFALAIPSASAADQTTYTATITIPVPPASNYAGSGGGDGWAVAMTPTAVYNVFHHQSSMTVACHLQADATPCWDPRTITDAGGGGFATSAHPGLSLSQATGKLYVYGTRTSDSTGGVVCIDTVAAATSDDPFCGFTPLSAVGEAPPIGHSQISDGVVSGSRFYAFNFVSGVAVTGTQNKLMCFDLTALAACADQPYSIGLPDGVVSVSNYPSPSIAPIAGQIIVPIAVADAPLLACFDAAAAAPCTGAWPAAAPAGYISTSGAPFPLISAAGQVTGLCLPDGTDECYSLSGATMSTPAGMAAAIPETSGWNGQGLVIGPRVYVPDGNANAVDCFDASTGASCVNFPKPIADLELLYTVNPDPQRPTCIWVNADGGSQQIQNFDAFTGAGCGQGGIRVVSASVIVPSVTCQPASFTSLQVLAPARPTYASGSVAFEDGDANPIPGIPDQALDATGATDLTPLNLSTSSGLPQFLLTLTDETAPPAAVQVQLTWVGTNDPTCLANGATVTATSTPKPTPTPTPTATTAAPTVSVSIAPEAVATTEELAATGRDSGRLSLVALAALVSGAALVAAGNAGFRRRSASRAHR